MYHNLQNVTEVSNNTQYVYYSVTPSCEIISFTVRSLGMIKIFVSVTMLVIFSIYCKSCIKTTIFSVVLDLWKTLYNNFFIYIFWNYGVQNTLCWVWNTLPQTSRNNFHPIFKHTISWTRTNNGLLWFTSPNKWQLGLQSRYRFGGQYPKAMRRTEIQIVCKF